MLLFSTFHKSIRIQQLCVQQIPNSEFEILLNVRSNLLLFQTVEEVSVIKSSPETVIDLDDEVIHHDILVIGGGLAGPGYALELSKYADTAVVTKVHHLRSHSVAAQGGVNAALSANDSWEKHAFDTIKGGDYLCDRNAVRILTELAPSLAITLMRQRSSENRGDEKIEKKG